MRRAQDGDGRRSRPGRGLSVDRIVAATLELVDEQGIGAASMRAVSTTAGVGTVSECLALAKQWGFRPLALDV